MSCPYRELSWDCDDLCGIEGGECVGCSDFEDYESDYDEPDYDEEDV